MTDLIARAFQIADEAMVSPLEGESIPHGHDHFVPAADDGSEVSLIAEAGYGFREAVEWMRYDADLVRDALRYRTLLRWIEAPIGGKVATVVFWSDHGPHEPRAAELSAEIDTAISQSEGAQR